MQIAKITSKGQITIPKEVREILKLKDGSKVAFLPKGDTFIIGNVDKLALSRLQADFEGVAEQHGINNDEDVMTLIKEYRNNK